MDDRLLLLACVSLFAIGCNSSPSWAQTAVEVPSQANINKPGPALATLPVITLKPNDIQYDIQHNADPPVCDARPGKQSDSAKVAQVQAMLKARSGTVPTSFSVSADGSSLSFAWKTETVSFDIDCSPGNAKLLINGQSYAFDVLYAHVQENSVVRTNTELSLCGLGLSTGFGMWGDLNTMDIRQADDGFVVANIKPYLPPQISDIYADPRDDAYEIFMFAKSTNPAPDGVYFFVPYAERQNDLPNWAWRVAKIAPAAGQ
jgi:hypothetical protein